MKKLLYLLGDFYHNHDNFFETIESIFKSFHNVNLIDSNFDNFAFYLKEKPDILIIGRENRINPEDKEIRNWINQEIEEEILRYVENGGRLFAWHSGLANYSIDGSYCKLLKGYFKYHPEKQKPVKYYSENDFLGKEIKFEIVDEHYFVECDEKNTKVFLRSESIDGKSIAGWTHNFGKGKVLCLTPAHSEGLKDKNFRELLDILIKNILL